MCTVLGKANLTVMGNSYGMDTPQGWSPRGGQTKCAFGPFMPGGSSTGSAVGLSAGFCATAIGTENVGSLVNILHFLMVLQLMIPHPGTTSKE